MYHTALLQKFTGTKHFAAGEKAIKVDFKTHYYKLLLQYFANSKFQTAFPFSKLPTVLKVPEAKAAV